MSSFLRSLQRKSTNARVQAAEETVFRWLEERWSPAGLNGRRIPNNVRARMRQDDNFRSLVDRVLQGNALVADDLDHTPVVEQAPDGRVRNRMVEELGTTPEEMFCGECGEETETPGEPCRACIDFERTGS